MPDSGGPIEDTTWTTGVGFDQAMLPVQRLFFYLPFEHGENLGDQQRNIALCQSLPPAPWRAEAIIAAERHHQIVTRFGRFPHRNTAIGRASTPAEIEFLNQPNSGF